MDQITLKKLQWTEYEILCQVDDFCRKHNILYSLYAGTALGAVRHSGFIPWDDDIDIAMQRTEFDRFCKIWKNNPIEGYYLESILNDNNCGTCHAKVRKNGTVLLSKGEIEEEGHHGVWIDIFPLDKVSVNRSIQSKKYRFGKEIILLTRANVNNSNDSFNKRLIRNIIRLIPERIRVKRLHAIHAWLCDHMNDGISYGFEWKSMSTFDNIKNLAFLQNLDSGYTQIQFMDRKFQIFEHYKDMLRSTFGNYMELPPESERICKHEPVKVYLGEDL